MTQVNEAAYERYVFDEAARLALHDQDTDTMRADLFDLYARAGIKPDSGKILEVLRAQKHPSYKRVLYRDKYVDEGVVEALKEILREVYSEKIYA